MFRGLNWYFGPKFIYRRMRDGEDDWVTNELNSVMNEEDFDLLILRGKKLFILDDMVLELTDFIPTHPGGAFLLQHNVGRDISKFFYGGYQLDGNGGKPGSNSTAYAHSNFARKIANKYAIAAFIRKKTSIS